MSEHPEQKPWWQRILTRVRRLFTPRTVLDPVFGPLRWQPAGSGGFWEGAVYFAPLDLTIEVLVDSSGEEPVAAQHAFYRELQLRYESLRAPLGSLLHETYANWRQEFPRRRIWEEFTLAAVVIPANGDPRTPWELSYECRSDEHSFDVQMEGWTPQGVAING